MQNHYIHIHKLFYLLFQYQILMLQDVEKEYN